MSRKISKYNPEGYPDPTTYEAMTRVTQEEVELENRANALIKVLKFIIRNCGFELLARIEIKDSKTGRCFR